MNTFWFWGGSRIYKEEVAIEGHQIDLWRYWRSDILAQPMRSWRQRNRMSSRFGSVLRRPQLVSQIWTIALNTRLKGNHTSLLYQLGKQTHKRRHCFQLRTFARQLRAFWCMVYMRRWRTRQEGGMAEAEPIFQLSFLIDDRIVAYCSRPFKGLYFSDLRAWNIH